MGDVGPRRILIIEDDLKLANLVKEFLESNGFIVLVELRGDKAPERILDEMPDLVILDLMLPGLDGLSVCRKVRDHFNNPILMLTARGDEVDEIVGLEVGADDYMAKPVRPRLLLARVGTLLRRASQLSSREGRGSFTANGRVELGALVIDTSSRTVVMGKTNIDLTTSEFDLLWCLARRAGETVTREEIFQELRGIEWDGMDRSIDLRIARLRKKLGDDGKETQFIKSVRGAGYLLAVKP
jgi:two-component system response regulator RstA